MVRIGFLQAVYHILWDSKLYCMVIELTIIHSAKELSEIARKFIKGVFFAQALSTLFSVNFEAYLLLPSPENGRLGRSPKSSAPVAGKL